MREAGESNIYLWCILNNAVCQCPVMTHKRTIRPLFLLAHKIRGLEEEQASMFPLDVIMKSSAVGNQGTRDNLEDNHDYLTEFLEQTSLVRYPKGSRVSNAFVAAKRLPPPKQTTGLSRDVQLLACLAANYNASRNKSIPSRWTLSSKGYWHLMRPSRAGCVLYTGPG